MVLSSLQYMVVNYTSKLTEMPFKAQRLKTFILTSVTDNLMVGAYVVVKHTNFDLDLF